MNTGSLMAFSTYHQGIQKVQLDLSQLYEDKKERRKFDDRFKEFMNSDPLNSKVIDLKGDILIYLTEEIVPEKINSRNHSCFYLATQLLNLLLQRCFLRVKGMGKSTLFGMFSARQAFLNFRGRNPIAKKNSMNSPMIHLSE